MEASSLTGFILATINVVFESALIGLNKRVNKNYHQQIIHLAINIIGVWTITRMALLLGLGVTSIIWVVALATAVTLGKLVVSAMIKTNA